MDPHPVVPSTAEPSPEDVRLRIGAPVGATVLALVVLGAMLTLGPGTLQSGAVVVGAVVQAGLVIARGIAFRRAVRLPDLAFRWHQGVALWTIQAGLMWLVAGEDTSASAAIFAITGLVFAVVLVGFLRFSEGRSWDPLDDPEEHTLRAGTAPLPVQEGEDRR